MQGQLLPFKPSLDVAERVRALGRTEDVMFSPDQTRLAIAGFRESKILVIEFKAVTEDGVMSVQSAGCVELCCPEFDLPHGLAWIDDGTLVVANRQRDVVVVSVPEVGNESKSVDVEPLVRFSKGGDGIINVAGSVAVRRLNDQYFDFLVCNNTRNYVSRHIVRKGNGFEVISGLRLFEHGLQIPDGISISSDGDLVAVSNHHANRIDVFRNDADSAIHSPPAFSLGVPHYPHGVRFAMEDRLLLVADAGAPLVHVYARDGLSWKTAPGPDASITIMDDDAFRRGRINPEEGGPKGLDILADGSVLVVSCKEVPLAFFDFRSVRDQFVGPDTFVQREVRSDDLRMLETVIAAMNGQQTEIEMLGAELAKQQAELARLQAELAKIPAKRDGSLDQRFFGMVRRAALKALESAGKG